MMDSLSLRNLSTRQENPRQRNQVSQCFFFFFFLNTPTNLTALKDCNITRIATKQMSLAQLPLSQIFKTPSSNTHPLILLISQKEMHRRAHCEPRTVLDDGDTKSTWTTSFPLKSLWKICSRGSQLNLEGRRGGSWMKKKKRLPEREHSACQSI